MDGHILGWLQVMKYTIYPEAKPSIMSLPDRGPRLKLFEVRMNVSLRLDKYSAGLTGKVIGLINLYISTQDSS